MSIQATFLATLLDEWVRAGVTDAVVCPGNRSTLFSALLENDDRIRVHAMVDERSAAYFALGLGKATGRPALFWCTSGTATAQAHSAVIEAHYAKVPLLVCTSNRPPELHHVRDWQSIDQSRLYEGMTRWTFAPGVADIEMRNTWRSVASRAVAETVFHPSGPGPVHLDIAIREPWTLEVDDVPAGRADNKPWHQHHEPNVVTLTRSVMEELALLGGKRGVFVVGESEVDVDALYGAASTLGWPVLAEARSGARRAHPQCITAYDLMLRDGAFAQSVQPEVVVHIGSAPISKFVPTWIQNAAAEEWVVDAHNTWSGSKNHSARIAQVDPTSFCFALSTANDDAMNFMWLKTWRDAEERAQDTLAAALEMRDELNEPGIARALAHGLDHTNNLFAATSMPVRDVETFSGANLRAHVYANRGASGMEGMTSTAAGLALSTGRATVALVGDLSFLYDLNALWALNGVSGPINLTIVVIDNNGGGIFSTLPQLDQLDNTTFDRVVATPHNIDIAKVAESLDIEVERIAKMSELMPAVNDAIEDDAIRVVYAQTDRAANAALHAELAAAVASALR